MNFKKNSECNKWISGKLTEQYHSQWCVQDKNSNRYRSRVHIKAMNEKELQNKDENQNSENSNNTEEEINNRKSEDPSTRRDRSNYFKTKKKYNYNINIRIMSCKKN